MKILDWNTCSFCRNQHKVIKKALSYNADIISLQEVQPASLEILKKASNYKLAFTYDTYKEGGGCHLVTLSKFPIIESGEIGYEGGDFNSPLDRLIKWYTEEEERHVALYTDIDLNGKNVRIYNIHLSWPVTPSVRFTQFQSFIENIRDYEGEKVIMGDLNVFGSLTYYNLLVCLLFGYKRSDIRFDERGWFDRKFEEMKLQNPLRGTISWPTIPFNAQLDHILIPKGWEVVSLEHTKETFGSDHTPYLLEVRF